MKRITKKPFDKDSIESLVLLENSIEKGNMFFAVFLAALWSLLRQIEGIIIPEKHLEGTIEQLKSFYLGFKERNGSIDNPEHKTTKAGISELFWKTIRVLEKRLEQYVKKILEKEKEGT